MMFVCAGEAIATGVTTVPIVSLNFSVPSSGLPPILDFNTVLKSVLLSGLNLEREPLDLSKSGGAVTLQIIKGWTRGSAAMLVALAVCESVGDRQVDDPDVWQHLEPLTAVLDKAWFINAVVRRRVSVSQGKITSVLFYSVWKFLQDKSLHPKADSTHISNTPDLAGN